MIVSCPKCGRDHTLPAGSAENKRFYFHCSNCHNKIVIDGRKQFASVFSGTFPLTKGNVLPTISSIVDSVACFFSLTAYLLNWIFSLFVFLVSLSIYYIFLKNTSLISVHPRISFIVLFLIALIIAYVYSILIYFIAKARFFKIDHPAAEKLDWHFILFDFQEDALSLLIFAAGLPVLFSILLIPVYAAGDYSFIYSAVFFPFLFIVIFLQLIIFFLFRYIPAIIASKSLYPRHMIVYVFSFIKREIINIPLYLIIIDLLTFAVSGVIFIFFFSSITLILSGISVLSVPEILPVIKCNLHTSIPMILSGSVNDTILPFHIKAGMIITLFFFLLSILSFVSFVSTVRLTLSSQSCWIMSSNPGRSVPRYIIIFFILGLSFLFLISVYLSSSLIISLLR